MKIMMSSFIAALQIILIISIMTPMITVLQVQGVITGRKETRKDKRIREEIELRMLKGDEHSRTYSIVIYEKDISFKNAATSTDDGGGVKKNVIVLNGGIYNPSDVDSSKLIVNNNDNNSNNNDSTEVEEDETKTSFFSNIFSSATTTTYDKEQKKKQQQQQKKKQQRQLANVLPKRNNDFFLDGECFTDESQTTAHSCIYTLCVGNYASFGCIHLYATTAFMFQSSSSSLSSSSSTPAASDHKSSDANQQQIQPTTFPAQIFSGTGDLKGIVGSAEIYTISGQSKSNAVKGNNNNRNNSMIMIQTFHIKSNIPLPLVPPS